MSLFVLMFNDRLLSICVCILLEMNVLVMFLVCSVGLVVGDVVSVFIVVGLLDWCGVGCVLLLGWRWWLVLLLVLCIVG